MSILGHVGFWMLMAPAGVAICWVAVTSVADFGWRALLVWFWVAVGAGLLIIGRTA